MDISLIAAVGKNREIGYKNKLLWHIKEDFQWFKHKTYSKPVVMGRSTYESIGKPLKGRINVVLSRDKDFKPDPMVLVLSSIEEVFYTFRNYNEVMIIGGEQVYKQFFPYAKRLYLTEIDKEFEADTFFPDYSLDDWLQCFSKKGKEDVGFDYFFKVYKKKLK